MHKGLWASLLLTLPANIERMDDGLIGTTEGTLHHDTVVMNHRFSPRQPFIPQAVTSQLSVYSFAGLVILGSILTTALLIIQRS